MTTQEKSKQGFWQSLFGRDEGQEPHEEVPEPVVEATVQESGPELEIAPNDPIVVYFASASGMVAGAIKNVGLSGQRLERLKTAVAEATMNAMEHGNHYRPEMPVKIRVLSSEADLMVRITDQGGSPVPDPDQEAPDLEAKLEGLQTPRGWGLFLIKNMVDEMNVTSDESHHTIEVVMHLEGDDDAH
jgi:serine/threonine-protein kinase RsbW